MSNTFWRKKGEDMNLALKNLKVGDATLFDEVTGFRITRVPGGYIYHSDYAGMAFVPLCYDSAAGIEMKKVEKEEKLGTQRAPMRKEEQKAVKK